MAYDYSHEIKYEYPYLISPIMVVSWQTIQIKQNVVKSRMIQKRKKAS
jgi:hypothetical protein